MTYGRVLVLAALAILASGCDVNVSSSEDIGSAGASGATSRPTLDGAMKAAEKTVAEQGSALQGTLADAGADLRNELADLEEKFPDLPSIPKLTGDKETDKGALIGALEKLQGVWQEAKDAHDALAKSGAKADSPALQALKEKNDALQQLIDRVHDMVDKLRD